MSIGDRLNAVRQILSDTHIDAIVVTNPTNRRYLTGFTAEDHAADESAGIVLITKLAATLLVSPTNLPWAEAEVNLDHINVEPVTGSVAEAVAARLSGSNGARLAIEDATTPAALWFSFQDALPEDVEIVRAGDTIDQLRAVKTEDELVLLRTAAILTDQAFVIATSRFSAGMTEHECAELVRAALREVGSEGEAFDTIVAAGPNAAKPHHRPGARVVQPGEPVIIDMGARVDGYNGDLTRTICLGKADTKLVRIYEAVFDAQLAGLRAIRAGVPASAPDLATREVFASRELGRYVIHSAGHGLGLRVHEAPSVRKSSGAVLEVGNVITMEPGLYIPGWGGVRIEDVAIVHGSDHENMTASPKSIESLEL